MRKVILLFGLILLLNGCSVISELTAFTKCEFRFHSAQDPTFCGIDISQKRSWSDFSFMEGQTIAGKLLKKTLPFAITINVEVKNPGTTVAAVNSIQWLAFIDDMQLAQGRVDRRVEVPPSGGTNMVPVRVEADLIDYLEGDSPGTMMNFALNLMNAGNQTSEMTLKIKPSILIGSQSIHYPNYFVITREFKSGN